MYQKLHRQYNIEENRSYTCVSGAHSIMGQMHNFMSNYNTFATLGTIVGDEAAQRNDPAYSEGMCSGNISKEVRLKIMRQKHY